jgi:beta-lactamase regulating signal transducer with metallopeptidase domain
MSPWSEALARWLVDYYVLATLLLAAAAAALAFVRQPARRLAVAWAALGSLALLAVLTALPGWPRLTVRPAEEPVAANPFTASTSAEALVVPQAARAEVKPAGEPATFRLVLTEAELNKLVKVRGEYRVRGEWKSDDRGARGQGRGARDAGPWVPSGARRGSPERAAQTAGRESPAAMPWTTLLVRWFLVGGGLALAWMALGALQVRRLCRSGRPAPEALQALLCRVVGGRRPPRLLLCPDVGQPVALGTLRPAILLPGPAAAAVPESQLEAVLAHEWAHIRRGDLWLLALTRWLLPVLFAHPFYWWLRSLVRADQEALADASAATAGGAVDYAAALLHWVRLGRRKRGAAATVALWGKTSELKRRITMLLDPKFPVETRCPGRWRWGAWSLTGAAVLALSVLTFQPVPPAAAGEPAAKPQPKKKVEKTPPGYRRVKAKVDKGQTTKAPPKTIKGPLEVAGTVLGAKKKPLTGARIAVVAMPGGQAKEPKVLGQTKTDAKGNFQLRVKPEANRQLVTLVRAKGYGLGWHFPQPKGKAVIQLRPELVVRLRLIDLQGQVASGVKVQVCRLGNLPRPNGMYYLAGGQVVRNVVIDLGNGKAMMPKPKKPGPAPTPALAFTDPPGGLAFWPETVTTDSQGRCTLHGIGRDVGAGVQVRDRRYALQALDIPATKGAKAGELTRILRQARFLEGTVTDSRTGKPIPFARLHVPSPGSGNGLAGVFLANLYGAGDLDWKGRKVDNNGRTFFIRALGAGGSPDALPAIDARADKHGRFRISLHVAGGYSLNVSAPDGKPYFTRAQQVGWPRAAARQSVKVALVRGVWVRGKVIETPANKPVANARVDFWPVGLRPLPGVTLPSTLNTAADGTFKVLVPPGRWHLLFNGASADYVFQKFPAAKLVDKQPLRVSLGNGTVATVDAADKKHFLHPDGWATVDLKPGSASQEVAVKFHKKVIKGKLVGPDGKPVAQALLIYRHPPLYRRAPAARTDGQRLALLQVIGSPPVTEPPVTVVEVRDGNFALPVHDRAAKYQLYFLDAKNGRGAACAASARSAAKGLSVRLAACGSAKARFLDDKGKPLAKYRPALWMLLPPGPYPAFQDRVFTNAAFSPNGDLLVATRYRAAVELINDGGLNNRFRWANTSAPAFDRVWWGQADPKHYAKGPLTDAKGNVTFPNLIAGATYRLLHLDGKVKDFKVEAGITLDLSDITIKPPPKPQRLPVEPFRRPLNLKVRTLPPPVKLKKPDPKAKKPVRQTKTTKPKE